MKFANVSKEDLDKYSLLLDKSHEELKQDLQELCKDYYLEYLFNNDSKFEEVASKLHSYLNLNIDAINDYVNYCLLVTINTLLDKLYHVKGYEAVNPGLTIERYKHRQAKKFIDDIGLNQDEILQTIEYTKQSNDLWVLRELTNISVNVKPNIDLPGAVKNTALANINYLGAGSDEIYHVAKFLLGLSISMSDEGAEFRKWFNDYNKKS